MALASLWNDHGRTQRAAESLGPSNITPFEAIAQFGLPLPKRLRRIFAQKTQQTPQHQRIHQQPLQDFVHANAAAV